MRWPQIDLGAQDLNDIQRPSNGQNHFKKIAGSKVLDEYYHIHLPKKEAYTQQGRAHSRRLRPDWAARPARMGRAAHAGESKAVVRIEVTVSPRPCLGCAVELEKKFR
jgi:hypothetical protein